MGGNEEMSGIPHGLCKSLPVMSEPMNYPLKASARVKPHLPHLLQCLLPRAASAHLGGMALPVPPARAPVLEGWVGFWWAHGSAFGEVLSHSNRKAKRTPVFLILITSRVQKNSSWTPSMQKSEDKSLSWVALLKQKTKDGTRTRMGQSCGAEQGLGDGVLHL